MLSSLKAELETWGYLHWFRVILEFIALIFLILTFNILHKKKAVNILYNLKHQIIMKYLSILFIMSLSLTISGQTIIGQWETFDDKTKEKKAVIEIYKTNNLYSAKIIKSFIGEKNAICTNLQRNKKRPTYNWINYN